MANGRNSLGIVVPAIERLPSAESALSRAKRLAEEAESIGAQVVADLLADLERVRAHAEEAASLSVVNAADRDRIRKLAVHLAAEIKGISEKPWAKR